MKSFLMTPASGTFSWKEVKRPLHLIIVILVFILDQASKWAIISKLSVGSRINLLPVLDIVHTKNKGAAFGMFHESSGVFRFVFFGFVTLICLYLLVAWLGSTPRKEIWQRIALCLVLGGALGNLKDRLIFGQVTDFILVYYDRYSWPAFNVADTAITIGVSLLVLQVLPWQKLRSKK